MAAAKKAAKKAGASKGAPVSSSSGDDMKFLLEGMQEAIGEENAMLLGSDEVALKIRGVISTRIPALDVAIGRGGVPLGRVTILHGGEGSGKTTLCLQLVAEVQSRGGWAIYFDNEHKLDPDYAEALGVDKNRLLISQPSTLEQFFDGTFKLVEKIKERREATGKRKPVLIVLDSINAAIAKAVLDAEAGDHHIAPEARIWSRQLPKLVKVLSHEDIALVLISQVRKKIGVMFGDPDDIGGGQAPRFYASLIMKVIRVGNEKEEGVKIANKIEVDCRKNQIAPPFKKAAFIIKYGKGADAARSLLKECERLGLVTKAGTWYSMDGERIGMGEIAATKFLRKHPEIRAELNKKFREAMNWEAA
jgi:recombination protein RecA